MTGPRPSDATPADDEATAHLLIVAALHAGACVDANAANTLLRYWDEHGRLEGAMYGVVMQYALDHAAREEQAALYRWIEAVTR